jgi:predicted nucleic acid-binding protein
MRATSCDAVHAVVAALLRRMRVQGERVLPTETVPVAVRDVKDIHLLAAALGGDADYLVTGDDNLLVLNGDPALGWLRIVTVRTYFDAQPEKRRPSEQ